MTFNAPGNYQFLLTADDGQATNYSQVTVTVAADLITLSPAYSPPSVTNGLYTVTATVTDVNGNPVANQNILIQIVGETTSANYLDSGRLPISRISVTDVNGRATFTYPGLNAGRDLITATLSNTWFGSANTAVKDWAYAINCGETFKSAANGLGNNTGVSREWPTNLLNGLSNPYPADYFLFNGYSGQAISVALSGATGGYAFFGFLARFV